MGAEKIDYSKLQKGNGFGEEQKKELLKFDSQAEIKAENKANLEKLRAYILADVKNESLKELRKLDNAQINKTMDFIASSAVKTKDGVLVKDVLARWINGRSLASIKPYLGVALSQALMMICCEKEDALKNALPNFHTSKAIDGAYGLNTFSALKEVVGADFNGLLDGKILNALYDQASGLLAPVSAQTNQIKGPEKTAEATLMSALSSEAQTILASFGVLQDKDLEPVLPFLKGANDKEKMKNFDVGITAVKEKIQAPAVVYTGSLTEDNLVAGSDAQVVLEMFDLDDDEFKNLLGHVVGTSGTDKIQNLNAIAAAIRPYIVEEEKPEDKKVDDKKVDDNSAPEG